MTGADITRGLDLMNSVLSATSSNTKMIPYYSEYTFNAVIGQEKYFIPNLMEPFSATFMDSVVRYATFDKSRREFHSTTKIYGIEAYPFDTSFERCLNGCNLYMYFLPCKAFPFHVWGKFGLEAVTVDDLTTDLLLTYDRWYCDYLCHVLVKRICNFYGMSISPEVQNIIDQISNNVADMNVIDLSSRKIDLYNQRNQLSWAQINIGKGFEP